LEGAGHVLGTDEPQRSVELILGFLDQVSEINLIRTVTAWIAAVS
jgi:hypothetical protein